MGAVCLDYFQSSIAALNFKAQTMAYGVFSGNLSQIPGGSFEKTNSKIFSQPIKQNAEEKEMVEFI